MRTAQPGGMGGRGSWVGVMLMLEASGCGGEATAPASRPPPPVAADAYVGGSRLSAVLAEATDGTAAFLHWWDTELGVECRFAAVTEPGASFRCRPDSGPAIHAGTEAFGDAECTAPLVSEGALPAGGASVVRRLTAPCYTTEYFKVGARFDGPVVHRRTNSGCERAEEATGSASAFRTLEPMPASAFVLAHDASVPATEKVAFGQIVAEDLSLAPNGFRDVAAGGVRCWPRQTVDGLRCLPENFAWAGRGGVYSDAECLVPAASGELGCGDTRDFVPYVFSEDGTATGAVSTIHEGGARLAVVYQRVGDECRGAPAEVVAFDIRGPKELGDFVSASLSQAPRPSGLQQTVAEVDGVTVARFGDLSASALGGYSCTLAATRDGAVRCVPPLEHVTEQFADPDCKGTIWQADFDTVSIASGAQTEIATESAGTVVFPTVERVLVDAAAYAGPVYARTGSACTLVPGVPNARQPYRRFGREVSLSELPELSIVVR